jgi:hypothetical protein
VRVEIETEAGQVSPKREDGEVSIGCASNDLQEAEQAPRVNAVAAVRSAALLVLLLLREELHVVHRRLHVRLLPQVEASSMQGSLQHSRMQLLL